MEPLAGGRLSPPPDPPPPTTSTAPPPDRNPPKAMKPQPASYSAVNVLGILPDNLRTPQNLEAGEISEDQQQELEKLWKEQELYEERKLKEQEVQQSKPNPAATNSCMNTRSSISPPGYEDVPDPRRPDNDYNNPVDTIPGHFMKSKETSPGKSSPPAGGRKFQIESRMNEGQEEYTPVFDTLPKGKSERIGMPPSSRPRGHSDSSPLVRNFSGDHHSDPTEFNFDPPNSSGEKPSSLPAHSLENLAHSVPQNETKRQSMKRNSAKELVEIDTTTKKVRMESQRKKRKPNGIANNNCNNNYLDRDRDSADGGVNGVEPAGSASPVKSKLAEFEISGDGPSDEYAQVNLTDKQQYRTEADVTKREGSGRPQHYFAAQKSSNDFGAESTSV